MEITNWRTIKDELEGWQEFQEIEKFMIYAEAEQYLGEFDDETVDKIIEVAHDLRQNTDYMSRIGIGMAIYNWLWWIFEDMEDDEIELEKIKIKNMNEDELWNTLKNQWMGNEWQ